jgi:hypothetical protein
MSVLCPNARCHDGAILLGIVLPDGRVAFAEGRTTVDREFVSIATTEGSRAPERRFRFSSPCAQSGCRQWTGTRCGVIDSAIEEATAQGPLGPLGPLSNDVPVDQELPACGIRADCRWFRQSGADACAVCELVITETRV